MSDLAQKLLKAINAKELKSHEASIYTYDEAGVMEMDPKSMEWQVVTRDGYSWVADQAGDAVALASNVDMMDETWDAIPRDRLEFMADNDPESVLRHCAADREIVDHFMGLRIKYKRLKYFPGILIEAEQAELRSLETLIAAWSVVILPSLARGYGVTP